MRYFVEWDQKALRQIKKLPHDIQKRIAQKAVALEENPRPPGAKKIRGKIDTWRVRVGTYRIVYVIEDNRLVVVVVNAGHRRYVYRSL